jgi:hypothetical protein
MRISNHSCHCFPAMQFENEYIYGIFLGEPGHSDRVHSVPQHTLDTQYLGAQAGRGQKGKFQLILHAKNKSEI